MRFQQALLLQKQQAEEETLEEEFRRVLQQVSKVISEDYEHIREVYNPLCRSAARIEKAHAEHPSGKEDSSSSSTRTTIDEKSKSSPFISRIPVRDTGDSEDSAIEQDSSSRLLKDSPTIIRRNPPRS
jgi:hypothetical protein